MTTNGPEGVGGGTQSPLTDAEAEVMRGAGNIVRPLRLPGIPPREAYSVALDRLLESMCYVCAANRSAVEAYRRAFQAGIAIAAYGEHGVAVEKLLATMLKRLDSHIATLPNPPGPTAA